MKSRFSSLGVGLLALTLCGPATAAFAQQTDANSTTNANATAWSGHRHNRMDRIARELNLTDAQKAQIKTIMQGNRATMRPVLLQLAQNRQAMLTATANGAFDQAKVQALANQRAQLTAQLAVQKASIRSQIYNQVLTSDQKAKADQFREKQLARVSQRVQKLSASSAETQAQ